MVPFGMHWDTVDARGLQKPSSWKARLPSESNPYGFAIIQGQDVNLAPIATKLV